MKIDKVYLLERIYFSEVREFHVLWKTQATIKDAVNASLTRNACLLCRIVFLTKDIVTISSYKSSRSRNLLIAYSQGKELDIADFNVLSLLGACVRHVYNFIPKKNRYDNVVLLIGGNDLFCKNVPSTKSAEDLPQELSDLVKFLLTKVKSVFVLGIPLRHSLPQRSKTVNALLASPKEGWKFRRFSRQIYSDKQLKRDNVHLSSNALSRIGCMLKSLVISCNFVSAIILLFVTIAVYKIKTKTMRVKNHSRRNEFK